MAEMPAITLINLTKRELFAALALTSFAESTDLTIAEACEDAVRFADALIAELAKP